ncbi:MAG: histidine kinase dimerization/phospho-acceptor domain-containing protein [Patescibacteria group bacterium]
MLDITTYMEVTSLVNGIVALAFAFLVISKNWRNRLNQLFFLFALSVGSWGISLWQFHRNIYDFALADFWMHTVVVTTLCIPVFFFHWIVLLTKNKGFSRIVLFLSYAYLFFTLLFINTPLLIKELVPKAPFALWPTAGILYTLYFFFIYTGLVTYALAILTREYIKEKDDKVKRGQYLFIFLGAFLGFGGGLTDFPLWFNIYIMPWGNGLAALFPFFFSYSMLRYRLFDVRSIGTEVLVFFISIILLIQTFASTSGVEFFFRALFFLIVGFLGYLLIRGAYREVNLNEYLKEKVEEQTKELRGAYEVEKKARVDLEKLNQEKDRFLLATQHNLRTPLTIIKGYVDVALAREQDSETRRDLEQAAKSTNEMVGLLNNVLEVTETRVGKKEK